MAYEGFGQMTATGEGADPAPGDVGGGSIGRCPNGVDTNQNGVDFMFSTTITPGAANSCL